MIRTPLYNEAVLEAPAAGGLGGAAVATTAATETPALATPPAAGETPWSPDLPENWHLKLGPEYAAYTETARNFKNTGDLLKSVVALRSAGPKYPGENATPEEISRFSEAAQVPKDAAGYGITAPDSLPEGVSWDQATADKYAEAAHKAHVPAPAFKALIAANIEIEAARAQQAKDYHAKQAAAAKDELVAEWRGDYESNIATARQFTTRLAETAKVSPEDAVRLANDPAFAKMAVAMAKLTSEHGTRTPTGQGDLRTDRQRADEIMSGRDPQWGKLYQEGDQTAMGVVSDLLKKAQQ